MMTRLTNTDGRTEANLAAKANSTVRLSAPDRTAAVPPARPAVDDDDAQWVTQRMFDHYNG